MKDNSALAISAENYISNRLYRYRILLAKPFFDRDGADLLALRSVNDNAKFIRIQSKGRTIAKGKKSFLSIPKSYVTPSFVVFLYVEVESEVDLKSYLYCFFNDEIYNWAQNDENFNLTIPTDFFKREHFIRNEFNDIKAERLIKLIEFNNQNIEFSCLLPNEIEILNNCLIIWKIVGVFPDANMLELFHMKIQPGAMSIQQLIFLYYSSFLKNEELQELNEDVSYELFFNEIKNLNNTDIPIFNEYKLLEVTTITMGSISEYHQYNKYIISELTVEIESSACLAIYIFCRDDKGEGIEMILIKDDFKNFRVRYIPLSSQKYDDEIVRTLVMKIKRRL
ncbi:hypothetical protein [Paenibacillus sp. ISL-20]|uniref:hypothetical protein n=1 Tax=Paenibacillus sp. ISL-20 TaxID=2819163 RepID=UPI001BE84FB2|nr:hypothetical protein [Paenibacillus sp. ISL-20]MBT2760457.1 hypothetical protein [Paenibacillus sp. ISL-20]